MATLTECDEFTTAYLTCALWSSTLEPFGTCPDCGKENQVLDRWNAGRWHVCRDCSSREPNYEPPADENYDFTDIAPELLERMLADCERFQREHWEMIQDDLTHAGHDLWLTRNGHGCGFWDGDWPENGDYLTTQCQRFGTTELYVGDDGLIYA